MDYVPETESYYALVSVRKDRVFIFAMWNGQYCVIDKHSGQVLKKGEGDDVLREYSGLVPLRLTTLFIPPSSGGGLSFPQGDQTWEELILKEEQKRQKEEEQSKREDDLIAMSFSQAIPGSELRKFYVVQFDSRQEAHAEPQSWRPLFVIGWKAENASVSLDCSSDIARIRINGRLVTPPTARKSIYVLQPDYSLQQLSITGEEMNRLFSHIKRFAEGATTSYERHRFPSDPEWEQTADPHFKIVDSSQKKTK